MPPPFPAAMQVPVEFGAMRQPSGSVVKEVSYMERLEKYQIDQSLKVLMRQLFEFGYSDFSQNLLVCQKHKDMNLIINELIEMQEAQQKKDKAQAL